MTARTAKKRAPAEEPETWDFHLFVAGSKPRSVAAYENLKRVCEAQLAGRYRITVIDLQKHPERAREADIAALPTVIRKLPEPLRRIIGDLSRSDDVMLAFGPANKL